MKLKDKITIVTGASRGIGRAIAVRMAAEGATVICNYAQNREKAEAVVKQIVDAGGKIIVEEMAVPGVGSFSLFEDPDGRVLGMWKQNQKGDGS